MSDNQTERVPAYEDMLADMIEYRAIDPVSVIECILDKFLKGKSQDERDREIQAIALEGDWPGYWQDADHADYIYDL
ncbi:MAG: hypothetical protein ABWU13_13620 [Limnospira maxima]|uniref:hypothetical protein n=1 Tax=Limnospira sp. Paracas R14 TaxID=2981108 RepID=UPI0028E14882|nr:hypothetical protein [Limnospira sp. Paracas R14]